VHEQICSYCQHPRREISFVQIQLHMEIRTIIHWISFAVYLYIFGYAGLYKITRVPGMMQGMESMGFGMKATLWIGWLETIGVLGLIAGIFIPVVKPVAVIFLWPFAIGALTTHFSYHHPVSEYSNALLVCIMPVLLLTTDRHFKVVIE
jgi:uncharacterized membrane protein YphA (DoxX/SURF4 family)